MINVTFICLSICNVVLEKYNIKKIKKKKTLLSIDEKVNIS